RQTARGSLFDSDVLAIVGAVADRRSRGAHAVAACRRVPEATPRDRATDRRTWVRRDRRVASARARRCRESLGARSVDRYGEALTSALEGFGQTVQLHLRLVCLNVQAQ